MDPPCITIPTDPTPLQATGHRCNDESVGVGTQEMGVRGDLAMDQFLGVENGNGFWEGNRGERDKKKRVQAHK